MIDSIGEEDKYSENINSQGGGMVQNLAAKVLKQRINSNYNEDQQILTEESPLVQSPNLYHHDPIKENKFKNSESRISGITKGSINYTQMNQIELTQSPQSDRYELPMEASPQRMSTKKYTNQYYKDQIMRIQQLKSTIKSDTDSIQQNNSQEKQKSSFNAKRTIYDHKSILNARNTIFGKSSINKNENQKAPLDSVMKDKIKENINQNDERWKILAKLSIAIRIKQKLLSLISQRIESVTLYQHYLIGDYADALNKKLFSDASNIIEKFNSIIFSTLNPGSILVIWSKIFLSILTVFNLIFLPIIFGFDLEITEQIIIIFVVSTLLYILEIIMNFKIAYYEMGELVTDQIKIVKRYLANDFVIDVITCVSLIVGVRSKYVLIISLLKVKNVRQYLWDIDNHYFLAERFHAVWILMKLFCFISVMAHYFACLFHYVGMIQLDEPGVATWIETQGLLDSSWSLRYNYALYFSFITCITIGYGDITPKNTLERNIVIIISLISTGCFSYSVNTMGTIFQQYLKKMKKSKEMRFDAINYMRDRQIHKNLQLRILKYIDYINQMKLHSPDKGLNVINQVSSHLKSQIFKDYYGKILQSNKYFNLNYSHSSLDKLSLKMKEKIYGPGEIIFEQKEQDFKIFYLMKGEIEFYIHNRDGNKQSEYISISQTNKSTFFGYKGFISGIPREMTCRSVNVSHVFYCSREDLISVLKEDPQDYEQFCKIRDEYLLYTHSLGEQCFSCKQFGHTISTCNKIHLIRNKQLLISKYNYSASQNRNCFSRHSPKYQTLLNSQLTSFEGMKYKLKAIMNLRKQHVSDEMVEQIILQDLTTDKRFQQQFPPVIQQFILQIQFRDKEYVLNEFDEQEQQSDHTSDDSGDSQQYNNEKDKNQKQRVSTNNRRISFKNKFELIHPKQNSKVSSKGFKSFSSSSTPLSSISSNSSSESSSSCTTSSNEQKEETKSQINNFNSYVTQKKSKQIEKNYQSKRNVVSKVKIEELQQSSPQNKQSSLIEFEQKLSKNKQKTYDNSPQKQIFKQYSHQMQNQNLLKQQKSNHQEKSQSPKNQFSIQNIIDENNKHQQNRTSSSSKQIIKINTCENNNSNKGSSTKKYKNQQIIGNSKISPLNVFSFSSTAQNKLSLAPIIDLHSKRIQNQQDTNYYMNKQQILRNVPTSSVYISTQDIQNQNVINSNGLKHHQIVQGEQQLPNIQRILQNQNYLDNSDANNDYEIGIIDFDSLKEFQRYFPHNNISVVCFNFKQHINKKNLLKKIILNHTQELIYNLKCKSVSGFHSVLIQARKNKKLLQEVKI